MNQLKYLYSTIDLVNYTLQVLSRSKKVDSQKTVDQKKS